jgi:hypothetical protein
MAKRKERKMQCPICGSEVKNIPAGTSKKTGKPYKAFSICSNQNCQYKPTEEGIKKEVVYTSTTPPKQNGKDEYVEGKEKNARLMSRTQLMCDIVKTYGMGGTTPTSALVDVFKELWTEIEK